MKKSKIKKIVEKLINKYDDNGFDKYKDIVFEFGKRVNEFQDFFLDKLAKNVDELNKKDKELEDDIDTLRNQFQDALNEVNENNTVFKKHIDNIECQMSPVVYELQFQLKRHKKEVAMLMNENEKLRVEVAAFANELKNAHETWQQNFSYQNGANDYLRQRLQVFEKSAEKTHKNVAEENDPFPNDRI